MVLAVYVNNADVSELCRGQRHDDALVAVVTDPATYALLALSAAVLVAAA
ncbi:MAG TPA: hypothetical protein PLH72_04490 [Vicinamibacterales bacterium]|nr:hypothetical protein [Vicinamibacterales bacterium]